MSCSANKFSEEDWATILPNLPPTIDAPAIKETKSIIKPVSYQGKTEKKQDKDKKVF